MDFLNTSPAAFPHGGSLTQLALVLDKDKDGLNGS